MLNYILYNEGELPASHLCPRAPAMSCTILCPLADGHCTTGMAAPHSRPKRCDFDGVTSHCAREGVPLWPSEGAWVQSSSLGPTRRLA